MLKPDSGGHYIFKRFLKHNVIAAFSDRRLNRKKFLKTLNIDYKNLVCAKQPHDDKVKVITKAHLGKGALNYRSAISGVDSLITNLESAPLAVFTADCLSIFLYDVKNHAAGLVHAGWKGTLKGIVRKAVLKMKGKFKTNSSDLLVGFGPGIRACCYEVGKDFKTKFKDGLFSRNGRFYLDLAGINKRQLLSLGVKEKNILDSRICTSCENKKFFSYRREGPAAGRMMSVIYLGE